MPSLPIFSETKASEASSFKELSVYGDPLPPLTDLEIVQILETYRTEAEYARISGPNSRDFTWLMNLDLYWNRFDFSKKAPWQAREVMPELPQYVDRFAAAMRTALTQSPHFFTVQIHNDSEGDLSDVIRKFIEINLDRCGRSPSGHPVDFGTKFEEIIKMGALMMNSVMVTSKKDNLGTYTSVEPIDPYNLWLDPTGRGLYRIRRIEIDLHDLLAMSQDKDATGAFLYNRDAIASCQASSVQALMRAEREKRTGTGQWVYGNRIPVVLHEYRCTLIDNQGNLRGENLLCVVANNSFLIRGPEKNPFWHQKDWVITAPIVNVPMSPYGRSYVENFASIARTFNELTNLLLDGVFTSAMKAFVAIPSLLEDPSQIDEGVHPNVVFRAQEGSVPSDVLKEFSLGQLPADAITIWQALKKELQEGAAFNEIALGQLAPKGRTSATEVGTAEQNSNSYLRSISLNIETNFLEPALDVVWQTSLQHLDPKDTEMRMALGDEWFETLLSNRKEFSKLRVTFICRGISSLVLRSQKLQQLLQFLQIVGSNQFLAQVFMQEVDPQRLFKYLGSLMDIDEENFTMSPRQKLIQQMVQQSMQQIQGAAGGPPGTPPAPGGNQPSAGPAGGQTATPGTAQRQLPSSAGGVGG